MWKELANGIEKDLGRSGSAIKQQLGEWVSSIALELEADPDMQNWINNWLSDAITSVVADNSAQISSLISDTVKTWDGKDASRRVELAIGRDLQFIRINGTLVGGMVGLIIHAVKLFV